MKRLNLSVFAAALVMSGVALAEGGGDRTFEKMMAATDRSMELFAAREQARNPVAVNQIKDANSKDL